MKKIYALVILLSMIPLSYIHAATCPVGNGLGDWTATTCTMPAGIYSIWGNITVGANTVTIPNNSAIITNLTTKKVTFTTGKMLFSGNGVMYGDAVGYTWYNDDTPTGTNTNCNHNGCTNCPSGKQAYNPYTKSIIPSGTIIPASQRGWIVCK